MQTKQPPYMPLLPSKESMEATKFLSSTLPFHDPQPQASSLSFTRRKKPKKPTAALGRGSWNYGGDYGIGRIVDENMIVLRMRIREMKMMETRDEPPPNWMEWEKKYYANNGYDEDVFEALGFLQNHLMNVRPGLALGLIALVTLSLVISTGLAMFLAIHMARIIIFSRFRFFS